MVMRNAGVSPVELSLVGEIGSAIVKSQSGSGHSTHNLLSDSRVPHIFTHYSLINSGLIHTFGKLKVRGVDRIKPHGRKT